VDSSAESLGTLWKVPRTRTSHLVPEVGVLRITCASRPMSILLGSVV